MTSLLLEIEELCESCFVTCSIAFEELSELGKLF